MLQPFNFRFFEIPRGDRRLRKRGRGCPGPGAAARAAGGPLRGGGPGGRRTGRHPSGAVLAPLPDSPTRTRRRDLDLPAGAPVSGASRELAEIPVGHYHQVMERGNPIRRAWHLLKFQRVLDAFPPGPGLSLLDIGCFAGSLLSLADQTRFSRQLGVDILPEQIEFASAHFGTDRRHFQTIRALEDLPALPGPFDCASAIELIEHITPAEIGTLFRGAATTPRAGEGNLRPLHPELLQHLAAAGAGPQPLLRRGLLRAAHHPVHSLDREVAGWPGSSRISSGGFAGIWSPPRTCSPRSPPRSSESSGPAGSAPRFRTPAGSCPSAISS